ncbi:hypothetical protein ACFQ36_23150, partial [Arthrobacter sp. GCM10027362]|uniref:hypothetical protein n=1 Tax=Arthrobacter sp. GCM10027362 TaxID=3273379 RepID=UPI00363DAC96
AARTCAAAALEALPRLGADQATCRRVEDFIERYTARGRSPADALVEQRHHRGSTGVREESHG